jgi:hypothetical protein
LFKILNNILNRSYPYVYEIILKRKLTKTVPLEQFLQDLISLNNHSLYAFCVATMFFESKHVARFTHASYQEERHVLGNLVVPEWAATIFNRQKRLCEQLGLFDNAPLFFIQKYSTKENRYVIKPISSKEPAIKQFMERFRIIYKYDIEEYIQEYTTFVGLPPDCIVIVSCSNYNLLTSQLILPTRLPMMVSILPVAQKFISCDLGMAIKFLSQNILLLHGIDNKYYKVPLWGVSRYVQHIFSKTFSDLRVYYRFFLTKEDIEQLLNKNKYMAEIYKLGYIKYNMLEKIRTTKEFITVVNNDF